MFPGWNTLAGRASKSRLTRAEEQRRSLCAQGLPGMRSLLEGLMDPRLLTPADGGPRPEEVCLFVHVSLSTARRAGLTALRLPFAPQAPRPLIPPGTDPHPVSQQDIASQTRRGLSLCSLPHRAAPTSPEPCPFAHTCSLASHTPAISHSLRLPKVTRASCQSPLPSEVCLSAPKMARASAPYHLPPAPRRGPSLCSRPGQGGGSLQAQPFRSVEDGAET